MEYIIYFFAVFGFLSTTLLVWVIVYALILRRKLKRQVTTDRTKKETKSYDNR